MEIEQFIRQIEWLDDERRKDKDSIARQEERLSSLEGNLTAAHQKIKDLTEEINRLNSLGGRMNAFDESLLELRVETNRQFEEIERQVKKREEEMEKLRRAELRGVDASLGEIRKEVDAIDGLRLSMQARVEEEHRLGRLVDELRGKIQELRRDEEEHGRTFRLVEDSRRQDSKRLVDMQGEVTALRKRNDEMRSQLELMAANFRKLEVRLGELIAAESERRDTQNEFLDKQALLHVERERIWKEWTVRLESMEQQAIEIEAQLQAMDATHREVKRAKAALDELSELVERRINELVEIQRLSEERFRQEWVTFKADDQKRWTNYMLTQEEQRGETNRRLENQLERLMQLEDHVQELTDLIQGITEQTEKQLHGLLALIHEWTTSYERAVSHTR